MATFATGARTVSDLATSVRDARLAAGMSQADLATAAHLTRPWVSLFESGRTPNASLAKVLAMMDVLGITIRLTYPVPDPDSPPSTPARNSPRERAEGDADKPTAEHDADANETRGDGAAASAVSNLSPLNNPSPIDEVALAAARAIRETHRARAIADDLIGRSSDV